MPQLIDWPHRDSFGIVAIGDEVGNGGRQLLLLLCAEILSGWGRCAGIRAPCVRYRDVKLITEDS